MAPSRSFVPLAHMLADLNAPADANEKARRAHRGGSECGDSAVVRLRPPIFHQADLQVPGENSQVRYSIVIICQVTDELCCPIGFWRQGTGMKAEWLPWVMLLPESQRL
jgi:hypothetical protein